MSGRPRATGLARRLIAVAILTLIVAVLAYAIYRWRTGEGSAGDDEASLSLPDLRLDDVDAGVRQRILAAQEAVRRDPKDPEAWGTLGIILLIHDFPIAAQTCLARAEQLDLEDLRWPYWRSVAFLSGATPSVAKGIDALKRSLALAEATGRQEEIEIIRISLAGLYLETGKLDEASRLYEQLRQADPRHPRAALGLAQIAFLREEWRKAERLLVQCRSSRHTRKAASALLAQVYERTGREEQAREVLQQVAGMPEDLPWPDPIAKAAFVRFQATRHVFVQHLRRLQMTGKQIDRDFLRQRARESRYEELFWLDEGERHWRAGRLAEAEQAFRKAIARDPRFIEARLRLSSVLVRVGKLAEAQSHLRRILGDEPTYAPAWLLLADCHRKLANPEAELKAVRQAVTLSPMDRNAQLRLAQLLLDRGQVRTAKRHASFYLMLMPKPAVAFDVAGLVGCVSLPQSVPFAAEQLAADRNEIAKLSRVAAILGQTP